MFCMVPYHVLLSSSLETSMHVIPASWAWWLMVTGRRGGAPGMVTTSYTNSLRSNLEKEKTPIYYHSGGPIAIFFQPCPTSPHTLPCWISFVSTPSKALDDVWMPFHCVLCRKREAGGGEARYMLWLATEEIDTNAGSRISYPLSGKPVSLPPT